MPPVQTVRSTSVQRTQSSSRSAAVNTQLPTRGRGFRTYGRRFAQYGTQKTVRSLQRIAERYQASTGKTVELGNISRAGGGHLPPHKTHRNGTDVDIRPPSRSGGPTTWRAGGYDRAATRKLIQEIRRENPRARILFNDPVLIREGLVRPARGHDNHLHVSLR